MKNKFLKLSILLLIFLTPTLPAQGQSYTILVWGDSLSSAYQISKDEGWVALLEDRLAGREIRIVNGSIPGEVTYGGAERISKGLDYANPDLVVLA